MDVIERAIRYVEACPPAIAGQGGHRQAFSVANRLVNGFALAPDVALTVLEQHYSPKCQPPWSNRDLRHKVDSAARRGKFEPGAFVGGATSARRECAPREAAQPIERFDAICKWLAHYCPLDGQRDVVAFLSDRRILTQANAAGLFALPPVFEQGRLVNDAWLQFGESDMLASGLVKVDDGARKFILSRNRLCLPWRRSDGIIQTLQRRFIGSGEPFAKYATPRGRAAESPFGVERLTAESRVVFCEGALDAMAIDALAIDPRTVPLAIPGVDGWRDEWTRFTRGRDVVIALDNDDAGRERAERLRATLESDGETRSLKIHFPPSGKDWGEFLVVRHG